ncbi:YciI family protein [Lacisediminihabitans sp.]|uniref:YciI family protein n=1 Tax=Lacisediminihabitans sp. TaxID=2787631 RepID=UPI00374DD8C1
MLYVSFYAPSPGGFDRVGEVYPRHRAYVDEFALGGGIWMIGTFGDPAAEGAMCVFRSREAGERFMSGDPFVTEGVVLPSAVREWDPLVYDAT